MRKKILAVLGSLLLLTILLMAQFPTIRPSLVVMESNVDLKLDPRTPWDITVWEYITSGNPWWYWYGYDAGTSSVKYGRVRVDAAGKFVIEAEEEIIIASDIGLLDDILLTFGTDLDASIEYDETTDDLWKFGVPVSNDVLALLQRADVAQDLASVPAYSNPTLALYGSDFTDYGAFYHDETDFYIRTLDGSFILQTDEGTNTASIVSIIGKGTQGSIFRMTDADDDFIFEIDNDTTDETAIFDAGGTDIIHYFATGSEYQDDIRLQFGGDDDAGFEFVHANGIFVLGLPTTTSLASSKGMVICDNDDVGFNHGGSIFTTANVRVHYMDSDTDTWFYIGYADDDLPNLESIHQPFNIQYTADYGVNIFTVAASTETPEVSIFGYRDTDALRSLQIGVGVDAADTVSFDGLSNYWFDGAVRTTEGQYAGVWGDGNGVAISDTVLNAAWVYGEIKSGTTITGGNVIRGSWERVLVNEDQANQVTIVGTESQIRVKSDMADGVHAGLWAYFEQDGTVALASPGQNAGISVTVEGSSGLTVDNGATLSGIVIDSSVHDDVTMNGDFDAIWIKVSGSNEAWENDIRLQNDETITNITDGIITFGAKLAVGSQAAPHDVSATREYGAEFHYSGNNYNATALRARAQAVTTDTAFAIQGALLQAANNDNINVGVLNGALIEAVGKATANAATITMMRGALVNTEWSAKDTITNLRTLHVRTHTRDSAVEGYVSGTGYMVYIENEAVGGNGQQMDAGIYLKATNVSTPYAFDYGIDFTGAVGEIATAEIMFSNGEIISNLVNGTILLNAANVTIGIGAVGVDYTLTFDGEDNDGVITWLEDEDAFDMSCDLRVSEDILVGSAVPRITLGGDTDDDGIVFGSLGTSTKAMDFSSDGLAGASDYHIYIGASDYWAADGALQSSGAFIIGGAITGSTLNLTASTNQIVLQSGGVTGTITATPAATNKVWTLQNVTGTIYQTAGTDVAVADGGTNLSSYAIGDILHATGTGTLAGLADVAVGSVMISGGVGVVPAWSTDIATGVTIGTAYIYRVGGTDIAVADGGTNIGVYAIGDLIYASTTGILSRLADVAVGQYLSSGGVGVAPAWATLNQAAVAGLTTGDSPVFVTTKLSGLTDGYVPYHVADATGLANSSIYTDGTDVGIGAVPTANMDGLSIELGLLTLKERATPTADATYGKIYTKTDNKLYFQDGAGIEKTVALEAKYIGEMYMYESAGTITIDTTDEYHLMSGFSTGTVSGWAFDAGSTGPIASYADYSGTVANAILVTDVGHGLVTGDDVSITGTVAPNDYNGVYTITWVSNDTFYIVAVGLWNADAGASTWTEGSYLEAGTDSAGTYLVNWNVTAAGVNAAKNWKFEVFLNSSEVNTVAAEMTPAGTNHQNCASSGFVVIVAGDRIYVGLQNTTDATNLSLEHANLNLHKI